MIGPSDMPQIIIAILAAVITTAQGNGTDFTKGIGKYPGRAIENTAPALVRDNNYRNVALGRQAFHSSAHDYNLTAQLVTDGIVETSETAWLEVSTKEGPLPVREREWSIDGGPYSKNIFFGSENFLRYDWAGMSVRADRILLSGNVAYHEELSDGTYSVNVLVSDDGKTWIQAGSTRGKDLPGRAMSRKVNSDPNKQTDEVKLPARSFLFDIPLSISEFSHLKIEFSMKGAAWWSIAETQFQRGMEIERNILPSFEFHSAWMSASGAEEWVYVDLGTSLDFDKVRLHWIEKAVRGEIQVSQDASVWEKIADLPSGRKLTDEVRCSGTGRYVRILMTRPGKSGRYVLSELEVFGRGGLVAEPVRVKGWQNGKYFLDGGNWHLARDSSFEGAEVSSEGFDDTSWTVATVPGSVLTSFVNTEAVPDPNYSDNIFNISESYFLSDFWYRTTFDWKKTSEERVFLNFDGINWKAEVYLNEKRIGRIDGAFIRGRFDITGQVNEGRNVLAVKIIRNAHPGAVKEKNEMNTDINGGLLGLDNPTFHSNIGWDWISTVRGRNIGIWNNVFLTGEKAVSLSDPLVSTHICGGRPSITPEVVVRSNSTEDVTGILRGWLGEILFEKEITVRGGEVRRESFLPEEFSQLKDCDLELWWPNGYGEAVLHDAGFEFIVPGRSLCTTDYKAGLREVTFSGLDNALQLFVNGQRVVPLGGNWGFSEQNLNFRAREYDIAVGYHKQMNFNMIRNWVGQTGDEEFYQACDRHGIMVWQDFWLANPYDGPDPSDEGMFLKNASDYVSRIRRHPSVVLYCGRNEGFPPQTIDNALRGYVSDLHPGLPYISSSADGCVSGHGPYCLHPAEYYFSHQSGKLHTERGMPNVMNIESLSRMLRPEEVWPAADAWGKHDFTRAGAQKGDTFNAMLKDAFGEPSDTGTFTALAQWLNYDGYRAMYEGANLDRQGLLIWMSHSCWPSLTWQTYDYYFDPTAAFFGCKKACEPIHIQYNAATCQIEAVNRTGESLKGLKASWEILDLYGKAVLRGEYDLDLGADSTIACGDALMLNDGVSYGLKGAFFLRLSLRDEGDIEYSENTYILSTEDGDLTSLHSLESVRPEVEMQSLRAEGAEGERFLTQVVLRNTSKTPALMVRLNLKGSDGEQILPVSYSDNYFHLMPGESRTVEVGWAGEDARGSSPVIEVTGFNIPQIRVQYSGSQGSIFRK